MKLKLHTRLLLSLFALLLFGFVLLGYVILSDARAQFENYHQTQALYQAKTLAESSIDALITEDYEVLEKLVQSALPSNEYAYASLIRPDGKILTHTNLLLIGNSTKTPATEVVISQEIRYQDRRVMEIIYPASINGKILANAHVGYYLDTEYLLQSDTLTRIAIVLLLSLVLIFTATHFVTRSVTIPIERLTRYVANASLDDSIEQAPDIIHRNDEIGELAKAFLGMSNRLLSSHQELTASLLSNKAIVDSANDGILVIDDQDVIESVNCAAEKIFGLNAKALIGMQLHQLLLIPHKDSAEDAAEAADDDIRLQTGNYRREIQGLRQDGSKLPLEMSIAEIYTDDKPRYACTIRDVSSRQEYEQALLLAKSAAEEGNRIKSEFLANISHELRTPMNSVLGYLDLMNMNELPDELRKYVNNANRSAEDLLEILNNILEFTRLEKSEIELDLTAFDIRMIANSLHNEFADKYGQGPIQLQLEIDETTPNRLLGDPTRVRNIIRHFMNNAYKFTKQGSIRLSIQVMEQDQQTCEICVSVADTGIGIAARDRQRIFELFTQADGSSTRRYGGTGIGLALCKKIIKSMHGDIGVDSIPDEGSTFWFSLRLPIIEPARVGEAIQPYTVHTSALQIARPAGKEKRILVVEDNPFNQDLMLAMLAVLNHSADVVDNGQLAVEASQRQRYDLILMDCQMPVMNGFEATRKIRETESSHTPIVAVTAHALDSDREQCLKSGMDDYMTKPYAKQDLQAMLDKWLA